MTKSKPMKKIEVKTIEEASAIIDPLMAEDKWAITVAHTKDDTFLVQWTEHKIYTSLDGKEYRDEVWVTKEGDMKLVQDLEPEHARNIIRMMLRNERENKKIIDNIYKQIDKLISDYTPDDSFEGNPGNRGTLH